MLGSKDRGKFVDGTNTLLDRSQSHLVLDNIRFVQQDSISKRKLLNTFVLNTLRFLLIQMLDDVFGIHDSDDAVCVWRILL